MLTNNDSPSDSLLYELPAPVTGKTVTTNVKPFESVQPLTFVCEAYGKNSGWNGKQCFFGLGDTTQFRVGQGYVGSTAYKTALYAKGSGKLLINTWSSNKTFRIVVTYDPSNLVVKGYSYPANSSSTGIYSVSISIADVISSSNAIGMNNGASRDGYLKINIFKVYGRIWSDEEIANFINEIIP